MAVGGPRGDLPADRGDRSGTPVKLPRQSAWPVNNPKKASTWFIQLADVGVPCQMIRG